MIDRLEDDDILRAVVIIAESDGVSVQEVARRGADDLALRLALIVRREQKRGTT